MYVEILRARRLERPTHGPLFSYKVTEQEFLDLGTSLNRALATGGRLRPLAADFCMFAAEALRRANAANWWTYEPVYQHLALRGRTLDDGEVRDAIEVGLKVWGRRLFRRNGRTEYLGTLVSEGGLPLAVLSQEGARLRTYFGELLRLHETYTECDVVELAEQLAEELPGKMNNAVVWHMAAALILEVARMRREGIAAEDADPTRLPLQLDARPARELIGGLRSAPPSRARPNAGVFVATSLLLDRAAQLRRELRLPPELSSAWLCEAICRTGPLPARLYLSVQSAEGGQHQVATALLQDQVYRLRREPSRPLVRPEAVLGQLQCIVSSVDGVLGRFVPKGGEALGDAPWLFDDGPPFLLRAQGGIRTKATSLLAAIPESTRIEPAVETDAVLAGYGRKIVRITSDLSCDWSGAHLDIRLGADSGSEFQLRGALVGGLVRDADVWLGAPCVEEIGLVRTRVPDERLWWRRPGGTWNRQRPTGPGTFEVGVGEAGREFRAKIRIVPRDFQLSFSAVGPQGGSVDVRSLHVGAVAFADWSATNPVPLQGGFRRNVVLVPGQQRPGELTLSLRGLKGEEVNLRVPFPAETATLLDRGGVPLPDLASISLDRLAHVRLSIVSPRERRWSIEVGGHSIGELTAGIAEASMEPYRRAIAAALAQSPSLDHEEIVNIEPVGGGALERIRCRVQRYDLSVTPVTVDGVRNVVVDPAAAQRLGPDVLASLHAEAVSLLRPGSEPVRLDAVEPGSWRFRDDGLAAGIWLVLVYQGNYLRGRPLRMQVAPSRTAPDSGVALDPLKPWAELPCALEAAMAVADATERRTALLETLRHLPEDLSSQDWVLLAGQLGTVGRLPPSTFDCIRAAATVPRIAVVGLLLAAESDRSNFWAGMQELPFLWAAVPIQEWIFGIRVWLSAFAGMPKSIVSRAFSGGLLAPIPLSYFLRTIHEAAYLTIRGVPEPQTKLLYQFSQPDSREFIVEVLEGQPKAAQEDLCRLHSDSVWPTRAPWDSPPEGREPVLTQLVRDHPGYRHTVLKGPFLLAEQVASGQVTVNLFHLRTLRDFDPEWFDEAFAAGLTLALGRRLANKEFPFNE